MRDMISVPFRSHPLYAIDEGKLLPRKLKNLLVNSTARKIGLLSNKFFAHAATEDSRGTLAFYGIKLSASPSVLTNASVQLGDEGPPIGGLTRRNLWVRDQFVGGVKIAGSCIYGRRTVIAPAADLARAGLLAAGKAVIRGRSRACDEDATGRSGSGELDEAGARIAAGHARALIGLGKPHCAGAGFVQAELLSLIHI